MGNTIVHNLTDKDNEHPFIVVRVFDGEYWFYGAYDDYDIAAQAAAEISGKIFTEKDSWKI